MEKQLITAIYLRISDEDRTLKAVSESSSITGQRMLLRRFISRHPELSNSKILEFIDDGYSGTNFQRPGIQSLLKMAEKKEINCIVVKDFSRFGRNYLETGNYLEQVFPMLGIRFLSVNDCFDSFDQIGAAGSIDVGFKNIIHDFYSRDLSVKIRTGRKTKAEQGKFTTGFAPYGYLKDCQDPGRLIVDLECAACVRRIFQLYLNGKGTGTIAKILNQDGILSPKMIRCVRSLPQRKNENHEKQWGCNDVQNGIKRTCFWTAGTISRILSDQRYTGCAVFGKTKPAAVGSKKEQAVSQEQWILVPNAHPAIISQKEFDCTKARMKKRLKAGKKALLEQPNM